MYRRAYWLTRDPVVAPGAGDHHLQGATCISLYPGDELLHPGRDAAEDQVCLQHTPPGGRRDTTVWGEAEALPHHGSASGTSLSAPDPQPVGASRLRHARVNETTNREAAPESLQFGWAFPCILQAEWDADPVQGLVRVSKLDVTDAYHRGTVKPAYVGVFAYVIPSAPGYEGKIICINLALPMGWVDCPKFFCAFSETLTDVANTLVNTDLPVPSYGEISEIPATRPGPSHTPGSITHIDCYIDDVISSVQGGPDRQHRVFDGTVRALKWLFPSLPGEIKDLVSVKNIVAGEGGWTCGKEVLGWILDT